jgi:hypothetical protein
MRLLTLAIACSACIRAGDFKCAEDVECDRGGATGTCQANGYCTFADASCASGQRFADLSGDVSNQCFGEQGGDFTVGGTATGVTGTLLLENNGDGLSITTDGTYVFANAVASGTAYAVSIAGHPAGSSCTIANDSGTVMDASVTDVDVTCGAATALCATGVSCPLATEHCCFNRTTSSGTCQLTATSCGGAEPVACDSAGDCGGGTAVCCAVYSNNDLMSASCQPDAASCAGNVELWCNPAEGLSACPAGMTCTGTPREANPGWTSCE